MKSSPQPNDFDRRRIERTLQGRKRYRYVEPRVIDTQDGYRIESACCSRNVDPDGGVVDIALLRFEADTGTWHLFRKNHKTQSWEFDSTHARLIELLELLNEDGERKFWQ